MTSKECVVEITYPGSVHFPTSSMPANSDDRVTAVHTQECCKSTEDFSDDDIETFHTPPTSLTFTDDVSCNYQVLAGDTYLLADLII